MPAESPDPVPPAPSRALVPDAAALPAPGQAAVEAARGYAKLALAPATRRAYRADWAHFSDWCRAQRWKALPAAPEAVAAYLATLATTHTRSTIRRRLAAIGQAHRRAGHDWTPGHAAIRATLRGILRQHGTPSRQAALATPEIRRLVATCGPDLAGRSLPRFRPRSGWNAGGGCATARCAARLCRRACPGQAGDGTARSRALAPQPPCYGEVVAVCRIAMRDVLHQLRE